MFMLNKLFESESESESIYIYIYTKLHNVHFPIFINP